MVITNKPLEEEMWNLVQKEGDHKHTFKS